MRSPALILALATFATGTQTYVFTGILEDMAQDLGVSIGAAGQLATVFAVTFAVLAPPISSLTAAWARRRLLVLALLAMGLLNLVAAAMPHFEGLLAVRVLAAISATLIQPTAFASAAALATPQTRGRAMSLVLGGLTLAFVAGIPFGTLVGSAYGWRATFVLAGGLALVAAVIIALALPRVPGGERSGLSQLRMVWHPRILPVLMCNLLAFTATFCVFAYVGPVIARVAALPVEQVGLVQAFVGLGSIAGIAIGGRVADRARSVAPAAVNFAVVIATQAVFVALMGTMPPAAPDHVAAAILALGILVNAAAMFSLTPLLQARLVAAAPRAAGVVIALSGSFMFIGQGLGAAIGGAVETHLDLRWVGLAGIMFAVAGAILALLSARMARRAEAAAATMVA